MIEDLDLLGVNTKNSNGNTHEKLWFIPMAVGSTLVGFITVIKNRDEWESLADQWEQERAKHPANPFDLDDAALDALCEPISNAETAVLATPATTLTDVERKRAVVSGWNGGNEIPAEFVDGSLADVRSLMGVAS